MLYVTSLTPVIRFIEGIVVGEIKEKNSNLLLFIERALWLVASVGVAKQLLSHFFVSNRVVSGIYTVKILDFLVPILNVDIY